MTTNPRKVLEQKRKTPTPKKEKLLKKRDYSQDTINAWLHKEKLYHYDLEKTNVSQKARCVLINWLIELHENYSFEQQILHCTVSILDTYTTKGVVNHENLQLVGVTSMILSAKNYGVAYPQVNELIYITGSYFTVKDLLSMETTIIKTLEYDLSRPASCSFLENIYESLCIPELAVNFARYFLDVSLFTPRLSVYPSKVACAALSLGLVTQEDKENEWNEKVYSIISYREDDYKEQTALIIDTLKTFKFNKYPAVKDKYNTQKYGFVSIRPIQVLKD